MVYVHLLINLWVILTVGSLLILQLKDKPQDFKYTFGAIKIKLLVTISVLLTIVGATITMYFILRSGSVSEFVYQVKIGKTFAGLYIFREISAWALILSGLLLFYSLKTLNKYIGFIAWGLILMNCIVIFSWGNRTVIGFFFLLLAFLYVAQVSKISKKNLIVFGFSMIVLATGMREIRDEWRSEAVGVDLSSQETKSAITNISLSLHLSQYDGLLLANRDVGNRFDYRDGKDFINGAVAWVPRFLWSEKPETHNVGLWFRQVYEPFVSNGWPISTLGDLLVNGGLILVILGALLTSFLIRIADIHTNKNLIIDYLALTYAIFVLNQGLSPAYLQKLILTLLPVAVCVGICRISFHKN